MGIPVQVKPAVARMAMAVAVLVLAAVPSWGSLIVSTFGPGDSYDTSTGWTVGHPLLQAEVAFSFVAGFDATLDSIRVGAFFILGPNDFTVYLASDSSGEPGAALETFNSLVFTSPSSILTLNSSTNPLLSSGATYWIVMTAADLVNSAGAWNINNQDILGVSLRNLNTSGNWVSNPNELSPAVEVNGTATGVIPEPSTVVLALTGLLAVFVARRRARR